MSHSMFSFNFLDIILTHTQIIEEGRGNKKKSVFKTIIISFELKYILIIHCLPTAALLKQLQKM